jgi:hypothetical protein
MSCDDDLVPFVETAEALCRSAFPFGRDMEALFKGGGMLTDRTFFFSSFFSSTGITVLTEEVLVEGSDTLEVGLDEAIVLFPPLSLTEVFGLMATLEALNDLLTVDFTFKSL